MTIWKHWCKGCGDRIGANGGGYCQAEGCRGVRVVHLGLATGVITTRGALLQDIDRAMPRFTGGRAMTLRDHRALVLAQPYDAIDKAYGQVFDEIVAGRLSGGVKQRVVELMLLEARVREAKAAPKPDYKAAMREGIAAHHKRQEAQRGFNREILQEARMRLSKTGGVALDDAATLFGLLRHPRESDTYFRVRAIAFADGFLVSGEPLKNHVPTNLPTPASLQREYPNRGARANIPGFSNENTLKVAGQFDASHGTHLDKVANMNGVMRKPGEADAGLRLRLAAALEKQG